MMNDSIITMNILLFPFSCNHTSMLSATQQKGIWFSRASEGRASGPGSDGQVVACDIADIDRITGLTWTP